MKTTRTIDDYYHYQLVCEFCGKTWWGLHCPHDKYQNPCPNCDKPPIPIKGDCECELVAPIKDILATIKAGLPEKKKYIKFDDKELNDQDATYVGGYNQALKAVEDYLDSLFSKGEDV